MSEIKVDAENAVAQGRYANFVSVTAQERDIVIDFMSVLKVGNETRGQLVSRVFLNRFTALELSNLIQGVEKNWKQMRYEASLPSSPEQPKE